MQVSSVVVAIILFLFHPDIYSSIITFLQAVNMANEANYNATNHLTPHEDNYNTTNHLTHEASPPIEKDFNGKLILSRYRAL